MSRAAINNVLWVAGLALQGVLLTLLLLLHGLWRRVPLLTGLIAFYLVRSAVLFGVYGHLAPANYAALYNGLSIFDLLAQLLVAVEIGVNLLRASGGWTLRRAVLLAAMPSVAWAAVYAARQMLPLNTPVPPDRLQMFDSLVMILLCAWALSLAAPPLLRRITLGFGFYGAFDLMATAERTHAAIHRDAGAFAVWSYTLSGAWLLVVAYWIVALWRQGVEAKAEPDLDY
jgi:hypothetical protein